MALKLYQKTKALINVRVSTVGVQAYSVSECVGLSRPVAPSSSNCLWLAAHTLVTSCWLWHAPSIPTNTHGHTPAQFVCYFSKMHTHNTHSCMHTCMLTACCAGPSGVLCSVRVPFLPCPLLRCPWCACWPQWSAAASASANACWACRSPPCCASCCSWRRARQRLSEESGSTWQRLGRSGRCGAVEWMGEGVADMQAGGTCLQAGGLECSSLHGWECDN